MEEIIREGAFTVDETKKENNASGILPNGGYTMHTFEDVK